MHPLAPNLSEFTDDELHKKYGDLQSRLMFAYRMGHSEMVGQLQLLMGEYQFEIQKRNQKMLEELQQHSKNFKDKINIAK